MLVVCRACGAEIEESARTCPVCGHENILKKDRLNRITVAWFFVLIFLVILIADIFINSIKFC